MITAQSMLLFDLASTLSAEIVGLNIKQPKFLQSETSNKSGLYAERIQDLALSNEVQCEIINAEVTKQKFLHLLLIR